MKASGTSAEIVLCVPGPWRSRPEFLQQVIALDPPGTYMFAASVLADISAKDHVQVEYCEADSEVGERFRNAGQGKISADTLEQIAAHRIYVLIYFETAVPAQRERIIHYTQLIRRLGGLGVKVESSGTAHSWDLWFSLLGTGDTFDLYCAFVTLIGAVDHFYSCGMHQFGMPDCSVSNLGSPADAAGLMNRFNMWQLVETPDLETGHTFSLTPESLHYRLTLREDLEHPADDLFHNPNGIWDLVPPRPKLSAWKRWIQ